MTGRTAYWIVLMSALLVVACRNRKETTGKAVQQTKPVEISTEAVGLNLGNKAPEIEMKNVNDSVIKLSSIKGKLVLIDFWASWCGPCRHENPTVVKAYRKYKDASFKEGEGFTVYSVSLDGDKNKWKTAIEKDELIWPYHVSDLKVWNNEAAVRYDVKGIPANVLIDRNGIILARNLRGEDLEKTLERHLKGNQ